MITLEYLRQFKIFNYAIFDFAVSLIGVYLLAPLLTKLFRYIRLNIPRSSWLYLTIPISILVHISVGTITPLTSNFLDPNGYYILKLVIIILTILGVKNIKIIKY